MAETVVINFYTKVIDYSTKSNVQINLINHPPIPEYSF